MKLLPETPTPEMRQGMLDVYNLIVLRIYQAAYDAAPDAQEEIRALKAINAAPSA